MRASVPNDVHSIRAWRSKRLVALGRLREDLEHRRCRGAEARVGWRGRDHLTHGGRGASVRIAMSSRTTDSASSGISATPTPAATSP